MRVSEPIRHDPGIGDDDDRQPFVPRALPVPTMERPWWVIVGTMAVAIDAARRYTVASDKPTTREWTDAEAMTEALGPSYVVALPALGVAVDVGSAAADALRDLARREAALADAAPLLPARQGRRVQVGRREFIVTGERTYGEHVALRGVVSGQVATASRPESLAHAKLEASQARWDDARAKLDAHNAQQALNRSGRGKRGGKSVKHRRSRP